MEIFLSSLVLGFVLVMISFLSYRCYEDELCRQFARLETYLTDAIAKMEKSLKKENLTLVEKKENVESNGTPSYMQWKAIMSEITAIRIPFLDNNLSFTCDDLHCVFREGKETGRFLEITDDYENSLCKFAYNRDTNVDSLSRLEEYDENFGYEKIVSVVGKLTKLSQELRK